MGLGPPSILRGWVPFQSVGLGPLSISGAGSPFNLRGGVPFQPQGLGPLSTSGAGSPFNLRGWIPFYCVGLGPLAIDWRQDLLQIPGSLEHPSAFYGAQHVWFCPTADPDLRGWVPFYCVGLGPPSSNGAGSPSAPWGWVPLQSIGGRIYCRYLAPWSTRPPSTAHNMCGSVPLLIQISGVGSPFTEWGWVPFQAMGLSPLLLYGAGSPFNQWGWDPALFCGTEYHRWWCHGVAMLCRVHLCAGGGICHLACPAV